MKREERKTKKLHICIFYKPKQSKSAKSLLVALGKALPAGQGR